MPRYRRDKVGHFYSNCGIINKVKTAIFVFAHFLENCRFLKVKNIFFEDSAPKGFLKQIIRSFEFFSLASDCRYLQSWALEAFMALLLTNSTFTLVLMFSIAFPKTEFFIFFKNPFQIFCLILFLYELFSLSTPRTYSERSSARSAESVATL